MSALAKSAKSSARHSSVSAEPEIRAILASRNPSMPASALEPLVKLVTDFADIVAELPIDQRDRIPTFKAVLRTILLRASRSKKQAKHDDDGVSPRDGDAAIEQHQGTGLGKQLSLEEGRERLASYVQPRTLESWAGPVAGPGAIEKQLHVARSTLNEWHRRGAVIGLLRGERKHVYPLDQFVDARPMQGIAEVAKIAPDGRAAWLWLRQPHGRFNMRAPLDLLRAGQRDEVIQAAERDFV